MLNTPCYTTANKRKSSVNRQTNSFEYLPDAKMDAQGNTAPLVKRVKKALACCRRYTKLSRSMSSEFSIASRHETTHRRRPTILDLGGASAGSTRFPTSTYDEDDSDPFITSPLWLKESYLENEVRPRQDRESGSQSAES
ncbi:hypothetical protein ACEQ8H_002196 [Pleosporales sp. CAS-2024a]